MKPRFRHIAAAALLAAVVPLGACSKGDGTTAAAPGSEDHKTLAAVIGAAPNLTTVSSGLSQAGLAEVFDGPGSYTLLAPDDDAFGKLGETEKTLTSSEHRAEFVALLRGHILPGYLTTDAIKKAIAAKKGPVKMTTLADSAVTFSDEGGKIVVTADDGSKATVDGDALVANNGIVIPLDGLAKKPLPTPAG